MNRSRTHLYAVWETMRQRCENKRNKDYFFYGAKGVAVCPEWKSFSSFRDWAMKAGYKPGLTIDRVDHRKGYSPGNCRWISHSENVAEGNRRRKGITKDLQLSRRLWKRIYMQNRGRMTEEAERRIIDAFDADQPILPVYLKRERPPAGGADGQ